MSTTSPEMKSRYFIHFPILKGVKKVVNQIFWWNKKLNVSECYEVSVRERQTERERREIDKERES